MSEDLAAQKEQLLQRIDEELANWDRLIAEVGEARMDRPGAAGDWTFRDVIAHLNGWRERTLARIEAARDGHEPSSPWPAELDEETDDGVDAINAWLHERDRSKTAEEVIAESRAQFEQMRALVAAIPPDDLFAPGRFPWYGSHAVADGVRFSFDHLYEEHMPAIRAWLAG